MQIFDSFELIVAPEVAQALGRQTTTAVGQTGESAVGQTGGDTACDASYPDDCIPPPPPNLNCDDDGISENFKVVGSDPHGFDGDDDGIGCETSSGGSDDSEDGDDDGGAGDGGDEGGGSSGGGDDDGA